MALNTPLDRYNRRVASSAVANEQRLQRQREQEQEALARRMEAQRKEREKQLAKEKAERARLLKLKEQARIRNQIRQYRETGVSFKERSEYNPTVDGVVTTPIADRHQDGSLKYEPKELGVEQPPIGPAYIKKRDDRGKIQKIDPYRGKRELNDAGQIVQTPIDTKGTRIKTLPLKDVTQQAVADITNPLTARKPANAELEQDILKREQEAIIKPAIGRRKDMLSAAEDKAELARQQQYLKRGESSDALREVEDKLKASDSRLKELDKLTEYDPITEEERQAHAEKKKLLKAREALLTQRNELSAAHDDDEAKYRELKRAEIGAKQAKVDYIENPLRMPSRPAPQQMAQNAPPSADERREQALEDHLTLSPEERERAKAEGKDPSRVEAGRRGYHAKKDKQYARTLLEEGRRRIEFQRQRDEPMESEIQNAYENIQEAYRILGDEARQVDPKPGEPIFDEIQREEIDERIDELVPGMARVGDILNFRQDLESATGEVMEGIEQAKAEGARQLAARLEEYQQANRSEMGVFNYDSDGQNYRDAQQRIKDSHQRRAQVHNDPKAGFWEKISSSLDFALTGPGEFFRVALGVRSEDIERQAKANEATELIGSLKGESAAQALLKADQYQQQLAEGQDIVPKGWGGFGDINFHVKGDTTPMDVKVRRSGRKNLKSLQNFVNVMKEGGVKGQAYATMENFNSSLLMLLGEGGFNVAIDENDPQQVAMRTALRSEILQLLSSDQYKESALAGQVFGSVGAFIISRNLGRALIGQPAAKMGVGRAVSRALGKGKGKGLASEIGNLGGYGLFGAGQSFSENRADMGFLNRVMSITGNALTLRAVEGAGNQLERKIGNMVDLTRRPIMRTMLQGAGAFTGETVSEMLEASIRGERASENFEDILKGSLWAALAFSIPGVAGNMRDAKHANLKEMSKKLRAHYEAQGLNILPRMTDVAAAVTTLKNPGGNEVVQTTAQLVGPERLGEIESAVQMTGQAMLEADAVMKQAEEKAKGNNAAVLPQRSVAMGRLVEAGQVTTEAQADLGLASAAAQEIYGVTSPAVDATPEQDAEARTAVLLATRAHSGQQLTETEAAQLTGTVDATTGQPLAERGKDGQVVLTDAGLNRLRNVAPTALRFAENTRAINEDRANAQEELATQEAEAAEDVPAMDAAPDGQGGEAVQQVAGESEGLPPVSLADTREDGTTFGAALRQAGGKPITVTSPEELNDWKQLESAGWVKVTEANGNYTVVPRGTVDAEGVRAKLNAAVSKYAPILKQIGVAPQVAATKTRGDGPFGFDPQSNQIVVSDNDEVMAGQLDFAPTPEQFDAYVEQVALEEVVHAIENQVTVAQAKKSGRSLKGYVRSQVDGLRRANPEFLEAVISNYVNDPEAGKRFIQSKGKQRPKGLSDADIFSEAVRAAVQARLEGSTEAAANYIELLKRGKVPQGFANYLRAFVQRLRELFEGKLPQEVQAIVDQVESLIKDSGTKSPLGTKPKSRSGQRDDDTAQSTAKDDETGQRKPGDAAKLPRKKLDGADRDVPDRARRSDARADSGRDMVGEQEQRGVSGDGAADQARQEPGEGADQRGAGAKDPERGLQPELAGLKEIVPGVFIDPKNPTAVPKYGKDRPKVDTSHDAEALEIGKGLEAEERQDLPSGGFVRRTPVGVLHIVQKLPINTITRNQDFIDAKHIPRTRAEIRKRAAEGKEPEFVPVDENLKIMDRNHLYLSYLLEGHTEILISRRLIEKTEEESDTKEVPSNKTKQELFDELLADGVITKEYYDENVPRSTEESATDNGGTQKAARSLRADRQREHQSDGELPLERDGQGQQDGSTDRTSTSPVKDMGRVSLNRSGANGGERSVLGERLPDWDGRRDVSQSPSGEAEGQDGNAPVRDRARGDGQGQGEGGSASNAVMGEVDAGMAEKDAGEQKSARPLSTKPPVEKVELSGPEKIALRRRLRVRERLKGSDAEPNANQNRLIENAQAVISRMVEETIPNAERIAKSFRNIPATDPQDVNQEAIQALMDAAGVYTPDAGDFVPYAQTAVRNRLKSLFRSSSKNPERALLDVALYDDAEESFKDQVPDEGVRTSAEEAQLNELSRVAAEELEKIQNPRKRAILKGIAEGKTQQELAQELGASNQFISNQLKTARQIMRNRLRNRGYTERDIKPMLFARRLDTGKREDDTISNERDTTNLPGSASDAPATQEAAESFAGSGTGVRLQLFASKRSDPVQGGGGKHSDSNLRVVRSALKQMSPGFNSLGVKINVLSDAEAKSAGFNDFAMYRMSENALYLAEGYFANSKVPISQEHVEAVLQEELIHGAWAKALDRKAPKGMSTFEYAQAESQKMLAELASTEEGKKALIDAFNIYYQPRNLLPMKEADLPRVVEAFDANPFQAMFEIGRMAIQLRNSGSTTEGIAQKAYNRVVQWVQAAIEELKRIALSPKAASPLLDEVIREAEAILRGDQKFARPLAAAQTGNPEFKNWFGDSKVVDVEGNPQVVYHGTNRVGIEAFEPSYYGDGLNRVEAEESNAPEYKRQQPLIFFTPDPKITEKYANESSDRKGPPNFHRGGNVLPVYLNSQKPFDPFSEQDAKEYIDNAAKAYLEGGDAKDAAQAKGFAESDIKAMRRNPEDSWPEIETRVGMIRQLGYDGIRLTEEGAPTIAVFEPNQIKSATGNQGTFDPHNGDIRYARSLSRMGDFDGYADPGMMQDLLETNQGWTQKLRSDLEGKGQAIKAEADRLLSMFADRFLPLKRVQEAIENGLGRPLKESENPYLGQSLYSGKAGEALDQIKWKYKEPVIDLMTANNLTLDEVEDYLYARHAIERNHVIAQRNPAFLDGGSGMLTAEAKAIIKDSESGDKGDTFKQIGELMDGLAKFSMRKRKEGQLLAPEEFEAWSQYKHYIPLRGLDEAADGTEPGNPKQGAGFNIRGKESEMALGRKSRATDLLAHAFMVAEEAAVRSHKNQVALQFHELVKNNPNDDYWAIDPVAVRPVFSKATGLVEYKLTKQAQRLVGSNSIKLKVDGKPVTILIKDERVAKALSNLDAEKLTGLAKLAGHFNRLLSALNTSYSLDFVVRNALRDFQTASVHLQKYGKAKFFKDVVRDYPKALRGAYDGLKGKEATEWQKHFREYAKAGGKVSFFKIDDVQNQAKNFNRELALRKNTPGAISMRSIRGIMNLVERGNQAVDNAVRLSTYVNARKHLGMSPAEAASVARNLTVDFNKRGSLGPTMNAFYLFFNASVQGNLVIYNNLKNKRVRQVVYAIVAQGFALDLLNSFLSPEDEDGELVYDKIPEYEKSRNMIFMLPNGDYAKIPLPYGYNVFTDAGRNLSALTRGKKTPLEASMGTLTTAAEATNPFGGVNSLGNFLAPTLFDPIVDLYRNRDFADRPIYPENSYDTRPPSEQYYPSASPMSVALSRKLNQLTGGDDFAKGSFSYSPHVWDYMFGQLTGSAGREWLIRVPNLASKLFDGEPLEYNEVPVLRTVVGAKPTWMDKRLFYDRVREIEDISRQYKQHRKSGNADRVQEIRESKSALLRLSDQAKNAKKALKGVRERREQVSASKLDDAKKKEILDSLDQREKRIIDSLNRAYLQAATDSH